MQAHPRYRELVEQGFAAASFVGDLGIRPLDCGPGWVEAGLDILPRHAQQNGFIHAGVQATHGRPCRRGRRRDPGGGGADGADPGVQAQPVAPGALPAPVVSRRGAQGRAPGDGGRGRGVRRAGRSAAPVQQGHRDHGGGGAGRMR
ncbi:hypothetical protein C534_14224 [Pseudomonas aeruginosa P49]|nr:hypothetical protein C533_14806 [Pseudomonas aeruginosa P47]OPF35680.1 hypothetical protein C532_15044 [Pseudomonas aeruginosa P37]OPF41382.1 hypothetical protein C531_10345 [Pseudomonas aeruginosa SD9]OPF47662.1 hypothetical protein C534_14224 [Pseudomonas aeruginosa P49]